jgi:BCCT family betaine/carnitine transporter
MVVANYSYKQLASEESASKSMRTFWAVIFILFPIALIFSENSLSSLQSVSIIAAFPVGIIIIMVVVSFFKDAKLFLKEIGYKDDIIELP